MAKQAQHWSVRQVDNSFYIIDRQGACIAEVNHEEHTNLIVAAPKMLAALQAIDHYIKAQPPIDQLQRKHDSEQISDMVTEAIAQASNKESNGR
jgi:hypothetical protein